MIIEYVDGTSLELPDCYEWAFYSSLAPYVKCNPPEGMVGPTYIIPFAQVKSLIV